MLKTRKNKVLALALGLCAALALAGCGSGDFYDAQAEKGLLDGRTEEEIAALSQQVENGMLQVSINANPVFLNGTAEGNLRIENAPGNPYDMRVTLTLEDGSVAYSSGGLKPNYHIEKDKLDSDLAAGEYAATARFYAVDKNHKDLGVVEQEITLTVLE